jgi:maleylpyruvate isomerase
MSSPAAYLGWMVQGHRYFMSCLNSIDDERLEGPSRLPGWTGRHVLSHVGHNAGALARLAHWAETGEPAPMYPSPAARAEGIESGAALPVARLRDFVEEEQGRLVTALDRLDDDGWQADVVTAQGRTVPATTIPWMRSREVWIHACDLPAGGHFTAFPEAFLDALIDEALAHRSATQSLPLTVQATDRRPPTGQHEPRGTRVEGPAADLAQWLTGRGTSPRLHTTTGAPIPELPRWL